MKTSHYESVVIINAALEESQIEETISKAEETIKLNGGELSETEKWGRKRLAYPIQKAKSGYYAIFRFSAPTDLISKLERFYRLDENIIRYLTVALDKVALQYIADAKLRKDSDVEQIVGTDSAKETETQVAAE
ncbi:MAG: 30S ribosomal protein S6 [Ignavibacteria bacterium]|nr:30S ribosomal protein S6 [Ignavibacteria bacterium]